MTCPACRAAIPEEAMICPQCGAPSPTIAPPSISPRKEKDKPTAGSGGDVIAGRFLLRQELGRGGMGVVYRAYDRELALDVAIKLLPSITRDEGDVDRLRREILAARRVTHRNVIRINEFGLGGRDAFIAMEYLTGGTLGMLLKKGPISISRGVEIALGLCEGLAAAHEAGVVHRDLKAENVIFDDAGTPKLVDFGLARLTESSKLSIGFAGTPSYMSPEQGDGKEVTEKSDAYSLGVLLFEIFTGTLPFKADSLVRMALLHAQSKPPALRSIRPDVPPEVEKLVLQALEKDPAKRPTVAEMLSRFHGIADTLGDSVRRPALTSSWRVVAPAPKRSRLPWVAGVALLALIAGGVAWQLAPTDVPVATPTATPIAEVTTATPAPTPTQVAIATTIAPKPTPKATLRAVVTPVPTPEVVATGHLSVTSFPSVEVWVDGKQIAKETPLRKKQVPAGTHVLRFSNPALNFTLEYPVKIPADGELKLYVNAENGKVEIR